MEGTLSSEISILVVDDFGPFCGFVRRLLEDNPEYRIVGEARDGHQALRLSEKLRPSLILLDIGIPGLSGIEVAKRLRSISSGPAIIFVSLEHSPHVIAEALLVGASGYVWKFDAGLELLSAIASVMAGEKYFSKEIRTHLPPEKGN
jgi:DNA-binding NarL/FixJ family response regulator